MEWHMGVEAFMEAVFTMGGITAVVSIMVVVIMEDITIMDITTEAVTDHTIITTTEVVGEPLV